MIRHATVEDIPRIVEMAQQFGDMAPLAKDFPVSPERVAMLVTQMLAAPDEMTCGLVAVDDEDRAVGQAAIAVFDHPMLAMRMASVVTWWVDPAHRGATGVWLLRALQKEAKARKADVMQISAPLAANLAPMCGAMGFAASEESWTRRI